MNTWHTIVRVLRAAIVCMSLLGAGSAVAAVPASWKDTGFAIDASGMTLQNVFEEFGRVYSVRLSYGLPQDAMAKGRLKASNGVEFLERLAQPYRFRWFVYNDTLYIVPRDDNASVRLQVGEDAVQDAKQALIGIGLFDSRFGWGELPDEGIVIVSGPRAYVDLARSILLPEEKKVAMAGRQVMVFRLKYASATDRVITSRGRSETVPGVKTILSNLLFGHGSAEKISDARSRMDVDSFKRSRLPKSEKGGAREVGESMFGRSGRGGQNDGGDHASDPFAKSGHDDARPRIEADPSLNAIIIYDNGSKRAMYQSLVEQLDIEPQQVEIEALIVDIDRSKLSELGVEWGARSSNGKVGGIFNSALTESKGVELPLSGSTLLISNAAKFYARLKAMEGNGEAHVLATPTVLTLDNVAAVLDLSQTRYVQLLAERYADMADITAGTMLRVIPRIVQDGPSTRVRLEVDIEDGALGNSSPADASVTRSTISTQAIVDVQQTLVIGGYHAESLQSNKHKVPVLGDVPVVGGLFRGETKTYGTRERLFLITPRLVGSKGTPATAQSRVTEQRAGSIGRASSALESARPAEMRVDRAAPITEKEKAPVVTAPAAPPSVEVSRVDPAPAAVPAQAKTAVAPPMPQAPVVPLAPALQPAIALRPAPAAAPAAAPVERVAQAPQAAPAQPAASRSPAVQQDTPVAAPARQEMRPADASKNARTTAASLDKVLERLEPQHAAPEPERQPVAAARPVSDTGRAYAGLMVGGNRAGRAEQPQQTQQTKVSGMASQERISGTVDLLLANRRSYADWR